MAKAKSSIPEGNPLQAATELYVVLDDHVGAIGEMSRILKKKNIAIQSVAVFVDSARLVVSDPEAALRKLQEHGYSAELRAVLQANVPNKRGILADMTQKLGNAGVNIKYLYCSLHDRQRKGVIIMEVDKPEFALKLFRNHQFE